MKKFNILLAEDNEDHAELVIRTIEDLGVKADVIHAKDGEEVLDCLYRRGNFKNRCESIPNLILLDLRMPKLDGLEVLRILKEDASLKVIPVIVLSSSYADNDVEKAYRLYANSYLVKPTDFTDFTALLLNITEYWLKQNKGITQISAV